MKGIIMAGGEGTRLRPLTCDCPKPMIRVMNRPVMAYALGLLRRHGITDIAATLGYLPDAIADAFGDGQDYGVRLSWYVERAPLGTAGGVRQARDFLDETFVVLSGDALTDLDIAGAVAFHRQRGALATLVLKRSRSPMEYGVVNADAEGRVISFQEKPDWADIASDTVNTGIYILEPEVLDAIPEDRAFDFGHELFPRLVADGKPVYGYVTRDYWCDVGDVRAYLAAHIDAMEGRIHLDGLRLAPGQAVQLPGAVVDRAAVLEGPCLIEAGAKICAGAHVGPYSVVGAGCVVGEQASLKRAILWPGARVEARAQARGCVLAAGASLGEGAQAFEECVLGTRARLENRSIALPGVKLWPGKRAAEGERLDANRVWGSPREPGFSDGTLGVADPAATARAAQACCAAMKPRELLIGHSGMPDAACHWHAAVAGALAQGVRVIDAGACSLPALRHAQRGLQADAALFIDGASILPLNALGAQLPARDQRAVALLNARQDFARPAIDPSARVLHAGCVDAAYIGATSARFTADPTCAPAVALVCENPLLRETAAAALTRAGLQICPPDGGAPASEGAVEVALTADGESCRLRDAMGPLSDAQSQLLAAWTALESGAKALILHVSATRGVERLAHRYGAAVEYVAGDRACWQNRLAARQPGQFELYCDGLALALAALSRMTERGLSLGDWREAMPSVHRQSLSVAVPAGQSGRVLHDFAIAQPEAALGGGVRFQREGGWGWIGPGEDQHSLRVVTEGASAEFARDLCDFCERTLKRLCEDAAEPDEGAR